MPESSPQAPTEFTTLPIVIDGELTDNFDSPDLLEGPLSEAIPTPEATTSPASLAVGEVVDIGLTPQHPDKLSLRDRFVSSRLGRLAMGGLAALGLAAGGVAVEASPAIAASNPVYTVTNHDNDGTNGIYYRNSTSMADTIRQLPYYARYGDRIELICGTNGEAVGQYGNRRWHLVRDLDNPKAPNQFYIPDHDTNTPNRANRPTPGERECGTNNKSNAPAQPSAKSKTASYSSVFFAPGNGDVVDYQGQKVTMTEPNGVYVMGKEGNKHTRWTAGNCGFEAADDFERKVDTTITMLGAWSIGRLGPVYYLQNAKTEERGNINYVLLIDPGSRDELVNNTCDKKYDQSEAYAKWLAEDKNNRLTILAGRVTYDKYNTSNGHAHAGLQDGLFGKIRGTALAKQVTVCNYSETEHTDMYRNFQGYLAGPRITSPSECPRDTSGRRVTGWRP